MGSRLNTVAQIGKKKKKGRAGYDRTMAGHSDTQLTDMAEIHHSALCCFVQFSYDKAQETSILFHVKDKNTEKKIDSTLNGIFLLVCV